MSAFNDNEFGSFTTADHMWQTANNDFSLLKMYQRLYEAVDDRLQLMEGDPDITRANNFIGALQSDIAHWVPMPAVRPLTSMYGSELLKLAS